MHAQLPSPNNNQERWGNVVSSTTNAALNILGTKTKTNNVANPEIKTLSISQKHLKLERENIADPVKREILRTKRNKTMTKIHLLVKKEETDRIEKQLENIESMKNDSSQMFQAIKDLNRIKPKSPLLIKSQHGLTANENEQTEIITSYFKTQFCKDTNKVPDVLPTEMRTAFTTNEISNAISQLRNNKSTGKDGVKAELLKYGPTFIHNEIANIFNETAKSGKYPKELTQGILCAIQKPGKAKGPVSNLRPIILLSILRKILAICLKKRIIDRLDNQIPPSQAAYRTGRSTTEHVFATKILAEKATTSQNYVIHLLMLDMSKAFDTVNRTTLLEDLKQILEHDELHLIKIMLEVELSVKCGRSEGKHFQTDIGVPQGDGLSANEFTLYLAKALMNHQTSHDHTYSKQINHNSYNPSFLSEHSYSQITDNHIRIDQEYADDISKLTTDPHTITYFKETLPNILAERGLHINDTKTEEYKIQRKGNVDWKKCKLLGSLLDTENDIKRRKGLAIAAINTLKYIFNSSKLNIKTKLRVFNCYISSIFLYNSELWTLTKTKENQIDSFHRRLIRTSCLNIKWPNKISTTKLYEITNLNLWSNQIRKRQLRWFGHLTRLPENTPAKIAFKHALEPVKRPPGKPTLTWISMMIQRFKSDFNISLEEAMKMAYDRKLWRTLINKI